MRLFGKVENFGQKENPIFIGVLRVGDVGLEPTTSSASRLVSLSIIADRYQLFTQVTVTRACHVPVFGL